MGPELVASRLRHIASKIDHSLAPDPALVRKDVAALVASLERPARLRRVALEIYRIAKEELEEIGDTPWDLESGALIGDKLEFAEGKRDPEDIEGALNMVKRQVDRFVDELKDGPPDEEGDDGVYTSAPTEKELRERDRKRPSLEELGDIVESRQGRPKTPGMGKPGAQPGAPPAPKRKDPQDFDVDWDQGGQNDEIDVTWQAASARRRQPR